MLRPGATLNPKTGRLFVIGTLITKKSGRARLKETPGVMTFHYKGLLDDGTSLWEARFPAEKLREMRKTMGNKAFSSEIQNEPQDEEALFQEEWLKNFYQESDLQGKELVTATFSDPSLKSGETNDFKSTVTVSICESNIYVRHAWIRHATPDALVRANYEQYELYRPQAIGMEDNAIGEFLKPALDLVAQEKKYHLPIMAKTNTSNKVARISRLSPLAERKKIFFLKDHSDQNLLREQLAAIPTSSVNDDGPDALEQAEALAETLVGGRAEYQSVVGRQARFDQKGAY